MTDRTPLETLDLIDARLRELRRKKLLLRNALTYMEGRAKVLRKQYDWNDRTYAWTPKADEELDALAAALEVK